MLGNINSIETMGLLDGPGVRYVVFLQGCPLRCIYCHNPETWNTKENKMISVEDLMNSILKYKEYFGKEGGVTISGGEPLLQHEFVTEIFKECKKNNIHTCLDTSGYKGKHEELLKYTDLVLLDIKGIDDKDEKDITSKKIPIDFLDTCQKLNKKLWIRHVIIPGINDNKEHILKLKNKIKSIKNIQKVELLPYHSLAKSKYEELNINYRLSEVKDMNEKKLKQLEELLRGE